MTTEEKRPLVSIATTLLSFAIYFVLAKERYPFELSSYEQAQFVAKAVLIFVPFSIIAKIVLFILYAIINAVITGEKEQGFMKDEFGKLVEWRSSLNSSYIFYLGFFIAMIALVRGSDLPQILLILIFSLITGSIVQDISQFYYLRKGIQ